MCQAAKAGRQVHARETARQGRAARAVRRITRPHSAYGPLLEYGLPVKSGVVCYGVIGAHLCASVRVALSSKACLRAFASLAAPPASAKRLKMRYNDMHTRDGLKAPPWRAMVPRSARTPTRDRAAGSCTAHLRICVRRGCAPPTRATTMQTRLNVIVCSYECSARALARKRCAQRACACRTSQPPF